VSQAVRRDLEASLRRFAGTVQAVAPGVWRADLRGQSVPFPLWVSDEGDFVRFVISPLLVGPKSGAQVKVVHDRLLRLNPAIRMVRFAVTPDGEIELMADQPASCLEPSEVRDCLDGLLYYADRYYGILAALCRG